MNDVDLLTRAFALARETPWIEDHEALLAQTSDPDSYRADVTAAYVGNVYHRFPSRAIGCIYESPTAWIDRLDSIAYWADIAEAAGGAPARRVATAAALASFHNHPGIETIEKAGLEPILANDIIDAQVEELLHLIYLPERQEAYAEELVEELIEIARQSKI